MFSITETDLKMVELYRDFLPEKIFDAHMHIYGEGTLPTLVSPTSAVYTRPSVASKDYAADLAPFLPGVKEIKLNLIPMPDRQLAKNPEDMRKKMNAHVIEDLKRNDHHVGSALILPTDSEEKIESLLNNERIKALKCYCFTVEKEDPDTTELYEYLPESAFAVSERRGAPIIIHMMKKKSLSDENNFSYITEMARKYPNSKIVLAHCARSFAPHTVVKKINELSEFDNVWFDVSAINESVSMMSCIKFNKKRVLFGTDYPVCMYRGRNLSFADNFLWLTGDMVPAGVTPSYILTEELLSLYHTALLLDLDKTDIENIFYNNAKSLFGE